MSIKTSHVSKSNNPSRAYMHWNFLTKLFPIIIIAISFTSTIQNASAGISDSIILNEKLYFGNKSYSEIHNLDRLVDDELWSLDSSLNEAHLVSDINPGCGLYRGPHPSSSRQYRCHSGRPSNFVTMQGKIYFIASVRIPERLLDIDYVWSYDGNSEPTKVLRLGIHETDQRPSLVVYRDRLFFSIGAPWSQPSNHQYQHGLWEIRPEGVVQVSPFPIDAMAFKPTVFKDKLYFVALDRSSGRELRAYDGNSEILVADLNPGKESGFSPNAGPIIFKNKLYFTAQNDVSGFELFSFDGVGVPSLVADLNTRIPPPGYNVGSSSYTELVSSFPSSFKVIGDKLYFLTHVYHEDPDLGKATLSVWSYDGSQFLQHIYADFEHSYHVLPDIQLAELDGGLLFVVGKHLVTDRSNVFSLKPGIWYLNKGSNIPVYLSFPELAPNRDDISIKEHLGEVIVSLNDRLSKMPSELFRLRKDESTYTLKKVQLIR